MGEIIYKNADVRVEVSEFSGPAACLRFVGNWGAGELLLHRDVLLGRMRELPYRHLVVQVDESISINSQVVTLLVVLQEFGGIVGLLKPSKMLCDVLRIMGIDDRFEYYDDFPSFCRSCGPS